jgi:hypothetical protein
MWYLWVLAALLPPVLVLSWPQLYRSLPRWFRDLLRMGSGAVSVLALWTTWKHPEKAWPLLPLLVLLWVMYARQRRLIRAHACDGCPELGVAGICSGYVLQAACMRAAEQRIERELEARLCGTGPLPAWLKAEKS